MLATRRVVSSAWRSSAPVIDTVYTAIDAPIAINPSSSAPRRRLRPGIESGFAIAGSDDGLGADHVERDEQRLGVGARTLRRRVQAETGLSYRDWRRILGLTVAAERLLAGGRVTDVAFETGYAGTSAFVAAFRAAFQVTPGESQRRAALRGTAPRGISGL